jgi:hypothetical protein
MPQILTSLYDTYDEAKQTVSNLESAGISHSHNSIVANCASGDRQDSTDVSNRHVSDPLPAPALIPDARHRGQ